MDSFALCRQLLAEITPLLARRLEEVLAGIPKLRIVGFALRANPARERGVRSGVDFVNTY